MDQYLDQLFYLYGRYMGEGKQKHLVINLDEVSDKDLVKQALNYLAENNYATDQKEDENSISVDLTPEGITYLESIAQDYQSY